MINHQMVFNFTECECDGVENSIEGNFCAQSSGECSCRPGWTGKKCQSKLKLIICIQYKTMKCLFYELENMMFPFVM